MKTYYIYYSKINDKIVVENNRGEIDQIEDFKATNVNMSAVWCDENPRFKIKVECNNAKFSDDGDTLIFT